MRKCKFTEEQMVRILREANEMGVSETVRTNGLSKETFYVWRKNFRGLQVDDVKRLKALEAEKSRLN